MTFNASNYELEKKLEPLRVLGPNKGQHIAS